MKTNLENILNDGSKKILFVGVGNVLRRDDGIGVYITKRIKETNWVQTLVVEVSLENYIKKIRDNKADLLILVDCIYFNKKPGYADIVRVDDINEYTMYSHNLSLKSIAEFFTLDVFVLGIQPADLRVGEEMTSEVKTRGDEIVLLINDCIGNKMRLKRKELSTMSE